MGPRTAAAAAIKDDDALELDEQEDDDDEDELPGEDEEEDMVDDNNNDDAAAADADGSNKQGRRRRRSRPSLMEESGMTEAERRALRHAQRKLHDEILEFNNHSTANDTVGPHGSQSSNTNNTNLVQSIRLKNNALYKKVAFTREAVLDGENLDLLAKRAMEQVDRLVQVPRFDAQRLARALRSKCSLRNGTFDWKTLGGEAGICFNAIPSRVAFLNGPLQADYVPKPARQVQKRVPKPVDDEEDEEEEVEDVKRSANQGKLSEVEHNIDQVKKLLKKRCDQQYYDTMALLNQPEYDYLKKTLSPEEIAKWVTRHGQDVCAIQFLFNPQSFTQTVENLFYFSFLVKMNSAEILIRQDETEEGNGEKVHPIAAALASTRLPGPVIRFHGKKSKKTDGTTSPPTTAAAGGAAPATAARQAIVNLTMQSWRELCEAYGVTKGDLPHRVSRSNNDHNEASSGRSSSAATAVAAAKKTKRRDHHHNDENNDDDDDDDNEEDQDGNDEEQEDQVAVKTTTRRQPKKRKVRASRVEVDEGDNEDSD